MKYATLHVGMLMLLMSVMLSGQSYVQIVWEQRYRALDPGGSPNHTAGYRMALRDRPGVNNDYVYVMAQTWSPYGDFYSCALAKYRASDGFKAWDVDYMAGYVENWLPKAICLDPTGNIFVTGTELDAAGNDWNAMRSYKITADGGQVWRARYRQFYNNSYDIVADENGCAYITGSGGYNLSNWDGRTIKYADTANVNGIGISLWNKSYDGSATSSDLDEFYAIARDSAGFIYVSGGCRDTITGINFVTIKYNAQTGDTVWVRKYDGFGSTDYAVDVVIGDSNYVYVTGESNNGVGQFALVTIKYDSDGGVIWTTRFDSTGANFYPREMAVDPSGNVYVTGRVMGSSTACFTAKYSANGNIAWIRLYVQGDDAYAIALDNSGSVYVTGESDGDDYLTIRYSPDGNLIWSELYDWDMGFDWAYDIVVDNSDFVYVTGLSEDPASGYFWTATIKYQQIIIDIEEECKVQNPNAEGPKLMVSPNPFSDRMEIRYMIQDSRFRIKNPSLKIYDASGRLVKQWDYETIRQSDQITWYGDDDAGRRLPAGIYICQLKNQGGMGTKKLIIVR